MWADGLAPNTVSLPGGLVLEDDHPLDNAELRPLTGREEDWLARHPGVPSALAVTRVLGSCLVRVGDMVPNPDLVRKLLVGDRDYLMLQLRRMTLGDEFQVVVVCPHCTGKIDVSFNASEVSVERRRQTVPSYTLQLDGVGGKRSVRFRLPTGADQEAALGLDPAAAMDTLLRRCLIGKVQHLGAQERSQVVDAMERVAPQVDPELDLTCPDCGGSFLTPFDATAFFLCEMRGNSRQLLREFHGLAFYYHWSEAEILSLERQRRRAYLALLSDELLRT